MKNRSIVPSTVAAVENSVRMIAKGISSRRASTWFPVDAFTLPTGSSCIDRACSPERGKSARRCGVPPRLTFEPASSLVAPLRAKPCAPSTAQTGSANYSPPNLDDLTHTTIVPEHLLHHHCIMHMGKRGSPPSRRRVTAGPKRPDGTVSPLGLESPSLAIYVACPCAAKHRIQNSSSRSRPRGFPGPPWRARG